MLSNVSPCGASPPWSEVIHAPRWASAPRPPSVPPQGIPAPAGRPCVLRASVPRRAPVSAPDIGPQWGYRGRGRAACGSPGVHWLPGPVAAGIGTPHGTRRGRHASTSGTRPRGSGACAGHRTRVSPEWSATPGPAPGPAWVRAKRDRRSSTSAAPHAERLTPRRPSGQSWTSTQRAARYAAAACSCCQASHPSSRQASAPGAQANSQ